MRFVTHTNEEVTFTNGKLSGPSNLVTIIQAFEDPCGCDYWGEIEPSFDSEWEAYLTICGALTAITGAAPAVFDVPANPDGYEEEGPSFLTADSDDPDFDWAPVHEEVQSIIARYQS